MNPTEIFMSEQLAPSKASHHRWSEIAPEPMNPLLTRQFVSGEKGMAARILLKKGCIVPEHSHPNEQIAMILSGALEFEIAGEKIVVAAGELIVIPADVPHSAVALEDTEDIDFFAPPRQDWIDGTDAYLR
jgi:quercetin dioxygenase-like cupin family protein